MATATGQPEPERSKGDSAGASHPPTPGSSERPSDPSKKYWWLAAVIVPVVVALIGIVPSFLNTASGSQYITNNQLDGDMYFTTNISVEDPALQEEVQRAVELAQQKQYADSAKAFEALAAQIQSAEIYNNLGVVQAAAGNMGPARAAYEQALALDPQFQGAHLNLGLIDKAEGKWLEAKEHFDRAGELRGAAGKVVEIDRHFGNNDILHATPIKIEATVSAEIVTPSDVNFYQFTAPPEPRDHLRVSLTNESTTLSPSFHFYDGKKSQVTSHSNGTPGADLSYDLATQPNETYYVKVFGRGSYDDPSSAGAYGLSISALKLFDRYEPNDEILRAVQIRVGVPVEAEIMDPDDVDFYQFTVAGVNNVTVTLTNRSTTLSPSLHFYDGKKSQVTSHSNGTPGADLAYQLATEPNGTYYVQVFGRGLWDAPASAGSYTLSVSP